MRRAWPNDSYRRNFQKYRDGRLYFGLSPKYNLHRCGKRLIVRYHGAEASPRWRRSHSGIPMPSGPFVRAPCTDALFSHLLSLFGVACKYRSPPLSALDATLMFARPPSALSMRMYSTFALNRATGLIRTTNASKKQIIANRTMFSPPFIINRSRY